MIKPDKSATKHAAFALDEANVSSNSKSFVLLQNI